MTSMYKQFQTDDDLEIHGLQLKYAGFRVTIARAGGANKKFARILEKKTKPYRRSIATETMDNDIATDVLREVYAEAIILNWEVEDDEDDEKYHKGIEAPGGGKLLPFNAANVVSTLKALPDLFTEIQSQANMAALFRQDILEDDAKN